MGWAREHCRGDRGWGGVVRIHRSACLWGSSWIPCQVNREYGAALPSTPCALACSYYGCTMADNAWCSNHKKGEGTPGGECNGRRASGGLGDAPPQTWNPSLEQCAQQSLGSFCRISLPSWGVALTLTSKMASYIGCLCQEEVRRKAVIPH